MASVLALSVSGSISQLSVIVAAAALLGVAVLTLLFFAQAREVKRLREWGAQAADRLAELARQQAALATRAAQRETQDAQRASQARTLAPAGQAARTTPPISRVSTAAATTNAGARQLAPVAGAIALVPTATGTAVPGLPVAGEQAPAPAAAATATSPAPASVAPASPPLASLVASGSPNDAAIGAASSDDDASAEAAVRSASPAAAAAATMSRPARAPLPPPPDEDPTRLARSAPEQRSAAPVRAASATSLAEEPRLAQEPRPTTSVARAGARSPLPPGPSATRRAAADGGGQRRPTIYRRERPRVRPVAMAVGALVVIVVAAVLIVSALGSSGRTASDTGPRGAAAGGHHLARAARGHATPIGSLRVVVLNATQVNGLAAHVASNLKSHGYDQASPLFGTPSGAYPTTTVQYAEGHAGDAAGVASVLNAPSADVKPMQSAVAPLSGGAPVVVIVGEATANEGAGGATKGAEAAPAEGEPGAETAGGETAEGGEATAGSQAAEPGA